MRRHWVLDPATAFLNHGSFGACPKAVLEEQSRLRAEMEADPVVFLSRELEGRLDAALIALGQFVGARAADLAFVPNATSAVNAVLRSLEFGPGDEILITDHAYEACANAAAYVAGRTGAHVAVAKVPFPLGSGTEVVDAVLRTAGPRVRLAVLDHVTSPTGLVWPIAELIEALAGRGIDTLVDGAHAPGMLPLDIAALRPAYYAGNCHKWICAPKGAGFLHVRSDRQVGVVPTAVSGLSGWLRREKSPLRTRFDWTGTHDPTAALCVPFAIDFVGSLTRGGWPEVMSSNRERALRARRLVCRALDEDIPAPDEMIGSMAAVCLPAGADDKTLSEKLYRERKIQVPVFSWGQPAKVICRISAHVYNTESDFQRLASALQQKRL